MRTVLSAVPLVVAAALPTLASAQGPPKLFEVPPEVAAAAQNLPLFQGTDVLRLTLSADFHTIRRDDRHEDPEEREGTLSLENSDGSTTTLALKLTTRGNWRLDRSNCQFPPLWLDFDKDSEELPGTVFEGQNRLKLYVTCRPDRDDFEAYILQEYSIYGVYNLLTPFSFRARPVLVTYVDTSGEDDPFTRHAFILEHKNTVAARNLAEPIDVEQLHPRSIDQEAAALVEVFNYFIGMTDYSSVYLHNVELFRTERGVLVPVPYDFDWSGMVQARYAKPDPSLPIRNVRQRHFQGFCRELDWNAVAERFREARPAIEAIYRDSTLLDEDRRKRSLEYVEEFYDRIEDEDEVRKLVRDCRRMPG